MQNDERLARMLGTCHRLWDYTDGFCGRLKFALPQSLRQFKHYHGKLLYNHIAEYVALADGRVDEHKKAELRSLVNDRLTKQDLEISFTLDAVSIVFYHSVFEAFVYDLIKFSAELVPCDWWPRLSEKKIPLRNYTAEELKQIFEQLLKGFLESVNRKPLATKCRYLIEICNPGSEYVYSKRGYKYSEKILKTIDTLGQDIVHGLKIDMAIPGVDRKIDYLKMTADYLLQMLMWKHKIAFNLMAYIHAAMR